MRILATIAFGLMWVQNTAPAQTTNFDPPPDKASPSEDGVVGAITLTTIQEFTPLTASERWRRYFVGAYGPGAIAKAAAAGGIEQWRDTPKEWRGGAEAYGDRFGSSYAKHVIESTLENGAAALLHEDNRYFRSTETGFWKRSKHAIASAFVARNDAGEEHFAYSRFGGVTGAAFISRIWQPHSTNTSGDAAVSFGISMATKIGWNFFKEFRPVGRDRH
jgi:hypothetical protein